MQFAQGHQRVRRQFQESTSQDLNTYGSKLCVCIGGIGPELRGQFKCYCSIQIRCDDGLDWEFHGTERQNEWEKYWSVFLMGIGNWLDVGTVGKKSRTIPMFLFIEINKGRRINIPNTTLPNTPQLLSCMSRALLKTMFMTHLLYKRFSNHHPPMGIYPVNN